MPSATISAARSPPQCSPPLSYCQHPHDFHANGCCAGPEDK